MTRSPDPQDIRKILSEAKVFAIVGVSANPVRPSFYVARYLAQKGYRVIGVNPGLAGQELFGETVRARVDELEDEVDVLDIFRRSDQVPEIVESALAALPSLGTVWMQLGVENAQAAEMAHARWLKVVQNRCPKIEYQRHFGELRKAGFNTGIISSRL